jgi:hypothetical protein
MWGFVAGNQCSAGTTISEVGEYRIINWGISYTYSLTRSIYISPTTGASYLNVYLDTGTIDTAVIKLDSSGTQVYAKYYVNQDTKSYGFAVDNAETYMYLMDSNGNGIEIVKWNAGDGTIDSSYDK